MPIMASTEKHSWWSELRHGGMLIAPALLEEKFPNGPVDPERHHYQRLREAYNAFDAWWQQGGFESQNNAPLYTWLDRVLVYFLGHQDARWQKGSHVSSKWKYVTLQGVTLAPSRVLLRSPYGEMEAQLFVWVEKTRQLGMGHGRTAYGKLLELLRAQKVKLGLLTNGRQFRLCYAGQDYDSWVEWDADAWFSERELRERLYGFYTLLGPAGMGETGTRGSFPLLEAVEASRTRQGELSIVLGEQVREAVEMLLHELNLATQRSPHLLDVVKRIPQGGGLDQRQLLEALYQAAVRMIMRLVLVFFAEARDMLPRSMPFYQNNYSLEGLYEQLSRAERNEGRKTLEEREDAWSRILSLFILIYNGSYAHTLPVREYGGLLFRPGEPESADATLRAVTLFESLKKVSITDATVLDLLKKLKIGRLKIRQGRGSRWVSGPVDFSELRTEYIGLMYQGLLDFNLYQAQEPMIFLGLGQEPILPLNLLEGMKDASLKELLKKLSGEKTSTPTGSEGEGEDAGEEEEKAVEEPQAEEKEPGEEGEEVSEAEEEGEDETLTDEDKLLARATRWAEHAVDLAGLVKRPKGKRVQEKGGLYQFERDRAKAAKRLRKRVLEKGEFYLIRRGGTRKGSGTFYTRPQLSVPITWRTLEPLAYTYENEQRVPRKPREILALKVCDPACGSASFLVAALHYLTDALYESLLYHCELDKRYDEQGQRLLLTLPYGEPIQLKAEEEILSVRPDDPQFEFRVKTRLRRYVVERCIYGVDLSPLAVELARMSLWIETMDRDLPFTFLDHKIKVGNALVGSWFETFREYPIMAWMREGGDAKHTNGIHYQVGEWTETLDETHNTLIKPELIRQIQSSGQQLLLFTRDQQITPENYLNEVIQKIEAIHNLPVVSVMEREQAYRALQATPEYQALKLAMDSWCAAWFWPADELEEAPRPSNFYELPLETARKVEALAAELHFFHWELEFTDVFCRSEHGFDVVLANPPWNTAKPLAKEFFSDYDLLYRTYGNQEALGKQSELFRLDASIEREWLLYCATFKSMSNWVKSAGSPFGDSEMSGTASYTLLDGNAGKQLHKIWRERRARYSGFSDQALPFRYQGSADLNTYKLFLEVAYHVLKKHGRMGLIVPSSIYTDKGSADLRRLFLDNCDWSLLFCFINRRKIFNIHSYFKFVELQLEKGGRTEHLSVTFNQEELSDLEHPERLTMPYPRYQVDRFSPHYHVIVEMQSELDVAILGKLYANAVLLRSQHSQSWQIQYANEFHLTKHSKKFPPLPEWEKKGYRPDGYGRWLNAEGDVALPLYEGSMVGAFDPSDKGWVSGKGRSAKWSAIPFTNKVFGPQYLVSEDVYLEHKKALRGYKIGFMDVGSAANTRSMYATLVVDTPCGNSVPVLRLRSAKLINNLTLVACLNAFAYDYAVRSRLGGLHLNLFVVEETPLIPPSRILPTICAELAGRLNLIMPRFAPQWLELRAAYPHLGELHWRKLWAITAHERLRLRCILDAIVAELYGLSYEDFAWILRDESPSNPKGFKEADKKKPVALRHTTLALAAFKRLKEIGLEAFQQEDWQLPPEVAEQLGPRFTSWQEELTAEESWRECEGHVQRMKELVPPPLSEELGTVDEADNNSNASKNGKSKSGPLAQLSFFEPEEKQLGLWEG